MTGKIVHDVPRSILAGPIHAPAARLEAAVQAVWAAMSAGP